MKIEINKKQLFSILICYLICVIINYVFRIDDPNNYNIFGCAAFTMGAVAFPYILTVIYFFVKKYFYDDTICIHSSRLSLLIMIFLEIILIFLTTAQRNA